MISAAANSGRCFSSESRLHSSMDFAMSCAYVARFRADKCWKH